MNKPIHGEEDLRIGDTVKTIFSAGEKFTVYDIRIIYSEREDLTTFEFKLNAINEESLKTAWLHREQLIPVTKNMKTIDYIEENAFYTSETMVELDRDSYEWLVNRVRSLEKDSNG